MTHSYHLRHKQKNKYIALFFCQLDLFSQGYFIRINQLIEI
jgi:hypothetical protein